jgi:dihydrofolate reductase
MKIVVIAAVAKNNIIGKNNEIPWHIKEDFQHFKDKTFGSPCIMGMKTFESLPTKPLPGRENIVLTFDKNYKPEGVVVKHSFEEALEYCKDKNYDKVFIIGGASIYKIGLEVADILELTRIDKDYDGEVYFPEINFEQWEIINQEDSEGEDIKNKEIVKFSFLTYKRKR